MKDYRVTVKVRNNRLLKAIEDAGGTPGQKWCEDNGLRYTRVNMLINMTSSPLKENGDFYPDATRLCEVLHKLPQDLWSNEQLYPLERNFSDVEIDHLQVAGLLSSGEQSYSFDFDAIQQSQTKALLDDAVSKLTEREQSVINMRFDDGLTYAECAEKFGVTLERVRQIEQKALRRLRHPSISKKLAKALEAT